MRNCPVILVSGWAHGEESLRPAAEALAPSRPVLSLSLASAGAGQEAEGAVSSYARTIANHLDRWDKPACLLGWSTGGVAALETAARYPDKVAGLVLLGTTAKFCSEGEYSAGVRPAALRAMILGLGKNPEGVLSEFLSRALHPLETEEGVLAARIKAALDTGIDTLIGGLEYLTKTDLRPELPAIALPCLILHGEKDLIVPPQAASYLDSNLPLSRLELLPATGHCLLEQCGSSLIQKIVHFVERL